MIHIERIYPKVFDLNMEPKGILEKSYRIGYEQEMNNLWTAQFTLPLDDPKNAECTVKRFIEIYDHEKYIGKFIINPKRTVKNEQVKEITYKCEHVLSTLHSDVLFGYHQLSNFVTRETLELLLQEQEVQHWVIGNVEIDRYFHYAWENEDSLLNALFSVPKSFDEEYIWTWDDSVYPFVLNLEKVDDTVVDEIRYGKNMKGITKEENPTNIITRIYPLGVGEGVNQLNIREVNGGVPYLEAEQEYIDLYGIQKKIWVDRRFEDANSLMASGQAFLDKYKRPLVTYAVDCTDYRLIDMKNISSFELGKVVRIIEEETGIEEEQRVRKVVKRDVYGDPLNAKLDIGHLREELGMTWSDIQKKQLVNDTYSQGNTNILTDSQSENADATHPVIFRVWIEDDVININSMKLTYETVGFRSYSATTKADGATTSKAGGGQTTSAGGGQTTSAGGGTTKTTSTVDNHRHLMFSGAGGAHMGASSQGYWAADSGGAGAPVNLDTPQSGGNFYTYSADGAHNHSVTLSPHTHDTDDHTHEVDDHTHDIPPHSHGVKHEITVLDTLPSSVEVTVDGNMIPGNELSGENIDLVPYLEKETNGKIKRNRWATIELNPDGLARINATVITRLFIQSHIGGTY